MILQIFFLHVLNSNKPTPAWMLLILFLWLIGTVLTSKLMMVIASLVYEKDERGKLNGDPKLVGDRVRLISFSWRYKKDTFIKILETLPAKSVELAKQWFELDFLFMFFLYPFMFFLCLWLNNNASLHNNLGLILETAKWLTIGIFLLDVLENWFSLRSIKEQTGTNIFLMRLFSIVKWIAALTYIILLLIAIGFEIWQFFQNVSIIRH